MKATVSPAASILLCALLAFAASPVGAQTTGQQTGAAPDGGAVFKQRCAICHAVAGQGGKMGPDLTGVVGRAAGSTSFTYSPAMTSARITWTPATLETFLAAPIKTVPGSRMVVSVSDAKDRQAVVAYLASLKK